MSTTKIIKDYLERKEFFEKQKLSLIEKKHNLQTYLQKKGLPSSIKSRHYRSQFKKALREKKDPEYLQLRKDIKKLMMLIEKEEVELKKIETAFSLNHKIPIRLGDFIDEVKRLGKFKKIILKVDDIVFPWGTLNCEKADNYINQGKFVGHYDIMLFNKEYIANPKFYFAKNLEMNQSTKFSNGKPISENIKIKNLNNYAQFNLINPEDLIVDFSLKDLSNECGILYPINLIQQAVMNLIDDTPKM